MFGLCLRMFLQETYAIEDCYYFDPQTTDKNRYTVVQGTASITYSSDGASISGTAQSDCYIKNNALTLPTEYVATLEITGLADTVGSGVRYYGGLCFDDWFTDWNSGTNGRTYRLSTVSALSSNLQNPRVGDVIKVVRESGAMKLYINGSLITTNSNISHTGEYQHRSYNGRTITVKNLKVKAL